MRSAENVQRMSRPRKRETRDQQLNLHLTITEMAWVRARADACGMRPPDYGRAQLLAERPLPTRRRDRGGDLDPLFLIQLSRIGNNLNQIARRLHAFQMPVPDMLVPILEAIRELLHKASRDDR